MSPSLYLLHLNKIPTGLINMKKLDSPKPDLRFWRLSSVFEHPQKQTVKHIRRQVELAQMGFRQ